MAYAADQHRRRQPGFPALQDHGSPFPGCQLNQYPIPTRQNFFGVVESAESESMGTRGSP